MSRYDSLIKKECKKLSFNVDCAEYSAFTEIVDYYLNSACGNYNARNVCKLHTVYELLGDKYGVSSYTIRRNLGNWCMKANMKRNDGERLSVAKFAKQVCNMIKATEG